MRSWKSRSVGLVVAAMVVAMLGAACATVTCASEQSEALAAAAEAASMQTACLDAENAAVLERNDCFTARGATHFYYNGNKSKILPADQAEIEAQFVDVDGFTDEDDQGQPHSEFDSGSAHKSSGNYFVNLGNMAYWYQHDYAMAHVWYHAAADAYADGTIDFTSSETDYAYGVNWYGEIWDSIADLLD